MTEMDEFMSEDGWMPVFQTVEVEKTIGKNFGIQSESICWSTPKAYFTFFRTRLQVCADDWDRLESWFELFMVRFVFAVYQEYINCCY